jgi:hypothetical protein
MLAGTRWRPVSVGVDPTAGEAITRICNIRLHKMVGADLTTVDLLFVLRNRVTG